jgi:hypothetical protein
VITPEQLADEEARAALWREQQRRRVAYQQALWASLAGDPAAAAALRLAWEPILAWQLEREEPDVDPEDDPGFDPLGISDQVNVGT